MEKGKEKREGEEGDLPTHNVFSSRTGQISASKGGKGSRGKRKKLLPMAGGIRRGKGEEEKRHVIEKKKRGKRKNEKWSGRDSVTLLFYPVTGRKKKKVSPEKKERGEIKEKGWNILHC